MQYAHEVKSVQSIRSFYVNRKFKFTKNNFFLWVSDNNTNRNNQTNHQINFTAAAVRHTKNTCRTSRNVHLKRKGVWYFKTKAVIKSSYGRCSLKKVLSEISQGSQENTLWTLCEIFKNTFLIEHLWCRLLNHMSLNCLVPSRLKTMEYNKSM